MKSDRQTEFDVMRTSKNRASKDCPVPIGLREARIRELALPRLEAWIGLVDDVDAALAAHHAVFAVTALQRLHRVFNLHLTGPSV